MRYLCMQSARPKYQAIQGQSTPTEILMNVLPLEVDESVVSYIHMLQSRDAFEDVLHKINSAQEIIKYFTL